MSKIHPKFIVDERGKKISVVLSIGDYEDLLEDIHDLAIVIERQSEPILSLKQVKDSI